MITNDVTLITFVPFTILVFRMSGKVEQILRLVVLETIAANLGSMATPIGNPQNLYLYSVSGLTVAEFARQFCLMRTCFCHAAGSRAYRKG